MDEHDLLDGWMLEILASGLVDDDVEMVSAENGRSVVEKMLVDDDNADMGVWLSIMMVDEEILEKVREKICVSCGRQCEILRRGCAHNRYTGKYCK